MARMIGTREEAIRWREWVLRAAEGVSRIPRDDLHDLHDFLERIEAHLPTADAVRRGIARLREDLRRKGGDCEEG